MIIVQLLGGLGNQLFQYAAARRLAAIRQVTLKLDIGEFENQSFRVYSLRHFNIVEDFATAEEVNHYRLLDLPHRIVRKLTPYRQRKWAIERSYYFDPMVLELSSEVYLEGYWQSERYFKDIAPVIQNEFTVKTSPNSENQAMIAQIMATETPVSLHIRRGDYASDPIIRQIHGLTPLKYYKAAVDHMVQHVSQPHFFVFSDDPTWVRQNLHLEQRTTYVEHNGAERGYEDLRLMSLCKHHIIANSSFSWWGAWLGSHPAKQVIAPKQWFNTPEKDTRDLLPAEWLQL